MRVRRLARIAPAFILTSALLGGLHVDLASAGVSGCQLERLPAPPGAWSNIYGADPSGHWLVGAANDGTEPRPILWHRSSYKLPKFPGQMPSLSAINRSGTVVGDWSTKRGRHVLFARQDGDIVKLSTPAGWPEAFVTGISKKGVVDGYVHSTETHEARPYRWLLDDPKSPIPLDVPEGIAFPQQTSGKGDTLITIRADADAYTRSYVVDRRGRVTELQGTEPRFVDVNLTVLSNGWAAGDETDPAKPETRQIRVNLKTGEAEDFPTGMQMFAINAAGVAAGDYHGQAALFSAGHRVLLPPLEEGYDSAAITIATSGAAAGRATTETEEVAVTWTCSG
jgi:hypothetical protein